MVFTQEQIEAFSGQGFVITTDGVLTSYTGPGGDVVIPMGVKKIDEYAFLSCSSITTVVIPQGVILIGDAAFWSCSSLQSIVLPEGVVEIGMSAFNIAIAFNRYRYLLVLRSSNRRFC